MENEVIKVLWGLLLLLFNLHEGSLLTELNLGIPVHCAGVVTPVFTGAVLGGWGEILSLL